jgi:hypothetical protein
VNWTDDCYCKWDTTTTPARCISYEYKKSYCDNGHGYTRNAEGECQQIPLSISPCNDVGVITVTTQIHWQGASNDPIDLTPLNCEDGKIITTTIPCGSVAKLGFFDSYNFIAATLLIFGVYFYLIKSKKYYLKNEGVL